MADKTVRELMVECARIADEHGFYDEERGLIEFLLKYGTPQWKWVLHTSDLACIARMHSELSELVEALRHGDPPDQHCPEFRSSEVELADLVIRALDWAQQRGLRLPEAMAAKMAYNESRPYLHGKKS